MTDRIRTLSSRHESQDYDLLKRDYLSLQVSYDHLKKRLESVERNKIDNEKRNQTQLLQVAAELKQKIQFLEANQKENELEVEDAKEKLKSEFAAFHDLRNSELTSELDELRQSYNSLRLQYTVLKTELESLQRSFGENEEKFRLQNEIRLDEFKNEKKLLLSRIDHLSAEAAANTLPDSEREKFLNLQKNFERSELELKNFRQLYEDSINALKSERHSHNNAINELNREIRAYKASILNLQQESSSLKSENLEFQKKIDKFEKQEIDTEQTLLSLRRSNELLKERLQSDIEELESRMNLEIIDLKKQRDIKSLENEDLSEKVKALEADLLDKRRQLDEFEIRLEEIKQNFKSTEVEQRESFLAEKRDLEKKLRDAETERNRITLKFERNFNNSQLKLQQCEFDKERIGEELASLKMQIAQTKLDEKSSAILVEEEQRKIQIHRNDETNIAIKHLTDDLERVKNELRQKDDSLKRMETKFEFQQEKNSQFYEILKLCESRLNAPSAYDFAPLSLMNDICSELKKFNSTRLKTSGKMDKKTS